MRADRHEALLDFLLEAVAVEGNAPFPPDVLAGLRRVVGCDVASYREWSPREQLEDSVAADEPESILRVWRAYPQVRNDDPLPGGAWDGGPLPDHQRVGRPLAISDFLSDREFRSGGLYVEICKPLGVRAVMKVFPADRRGNRCVVCVRDHQEQVHRDRPPHPRAPCPAPGTAAAQRTRAADLSGAYRFHRGGPDEATAPHATRMGRPRQGRGR